MALQAPFHGPGWQIARASSGGRARARHRRVPRLPRPCESGCVRQRQTVEVPAAIGIDIEDPAVKEFDSETGPGWGGIPEEGCADPCISPLHTHFSDGVLSTEAASDRPNTLG